MKKMKKLLVLILSVLMVLGTSATVFAEETDTATQEKFNVNVSVSGIAQGNTLNLYRIVAFNLDESNNSISYDLAQGLPAAYDTINELAALGGTGYTFNNDADTKACADVLAQAIAAGTVTPLATITQVAGTDKVATKSLPAGWYVATVSGTNDTKIIYQNMIINAMPVVDSAQNKYKAADAVTFEVKHTNDDVEKKVNGGDSTDAYSVGDTVPYTITTNIPNYPNPSEKASFVIKDTPTGLTDDVASVKVTVTGDEGTGTATGSITGKFTVAASGNGFTVTFEKAYILAHPQAAVTVEYNATINENAEIDENGKTAENTATIKFNPNPNEEGTVEPGDTTEVYTYGVDVFKKDSKTNQKLTGAKFVLYKADGQNVAGAETEVDANGYVSWNGLAAGTYKLVETKAPIGYKLDSTPREITISKTTANKDNRQSASVTETNFLQTDVPNEQGSTLPSTGGMGTTILYIIGGALVVGCAIMLVAKKRTENK